MSKQGHNSNSPSGERLKSFVARIQRLEEDKDAVAEDIKDVYAEARGTGFDTKIIRLIIRKIKMGADKAAEEEALLDIYQAALGMLDGTPLGNAAIDRLQKKTKPEDSEQTDIEDAIEATEDQEPEAQDPFGGITPDAAREQGKKAASDGQDVTKNPFPARDIRRAAWEEGWCQNAGSDGMDIPEAWRRTKKEKKPDDKKGGEE